MTVFAAALVGQTSDKQTAGGKDYSDDHKSVDSIIKATYDVISGAKGEKRDWNRFRSLFHKDARLIPTGAGQDGKFGARAFSPEEYISRSEPFMMQNGFYESEAFRKTLKYGNIVHAWSTYEGRNSKDQAKPFLRGINSFQLLFDGNRWWILTIYWQHESPNNPLPEKFLKDKN